MFQKSFFPYRLVRLSKDQHFSTSPFKKVQKKHFPGWKVELSFPCILGTKEEMVKKVLVTYLISHVNTDWTEFTVLFHKLPAINSKILQHL